jgi:hypothetical protein
LSDEIGKSFPPRDSRSAPDSSFPALYRSAQRGIAVRKATETRDDIAVAPSIVDKIADLRALCRWHVDAQSFEQRHRTLLQRAVFGMLQRHIGEHALQRRQWLIAGACDA